MRQLGTIVIWVITAAVLWQTGCNVTDQRSDGATAGPPFGSRVDLDAAASLWKSMMGYKSWSPYPGLAGWQDGNSPHGKVLRYYVNSTAARDPMANGAIIIKENYGARSTGSLMAVTVMKKVPGYDPENEDWFWVKFDPSGTVMKRVLRHSSPTLVIGSFQSASRMQFTNTTPWSNTTICHLSFY